MENKPLGRDLFRWVVGVALLALPIYELIIAKRAPSPLSYLSVSLVFIMAVVENIAWVRIPGIVEVGKKVKAVEGKIDRVLAKLEQQQQQTQNLTVTMSPTTVSPSNGQTSTAQSDQNSTPTSSPDALTPPEPSHPE